jgi:hypothetical protein
MQAKKAIQGRVIYAEASPLPAYDCGTHNGQSTSLAGNYGSPPQGHLTPGQHITNKCGNNHYLQNNNTNQPYKFARLCITGIVQPTEKMHVHNNKEQAPSVCVQITQSPSIRHVTHLVLYAVKSHINVRCIMHSEENSGCNLEYKGQSSQSTPIVISIQIRGCGVCNQMILHYVLHGLIPLASAQFLKRIFHYKKKTNSLLLLFAPLMNSFYKCVSSFL